MYERARNAGPLKVVQVLLSPRIGGAESLAAALDEHWRGSAISTATVYLDESSGAPPSRLHRIMRLRSALRRLRPDVVLAHSALPNLYARIAAPASTPVVTVLHSASDDFRGLAMRTVEWILKRRTAFVVAVSKTQEEQYIGYFGTSTPIRVIPNGIRADIRTKANASEQLRSLVTVARIAHQKNPDLWIKVATRVDASEPQVSMTWYGPRTSDDGVSDLVEGFESSLSRFAGPTNDPASVLAGSDALFHPANREAHSIGVLEAAAAGLPVICSLAVAETLPPQVVAITFETGSVESAEASIWELERKWNIYSNRAIEMAALIRDEFSIANCADSYFDTFQRVVAARR